MTIKTENINPPIPSRLTDWAAWDEDNPEGGCGYGATEEEAIQSFKELDEHDES